MDGSSATGGRERTSRLGSWLGGGVGRPVLLKGAGFEATVFARSRNLGWRKVEDVLRARKAGVAGGLWRGKKRERRLFVAGRIGSVGVGRLDGQS